MTGARSFSRAQVLAHRAHLQGLSGTTRLEVLGLDVLGLGLQDTPAGSARWDCGPRTGDAVRINRARTRPGDDGPRLAAPAPAQRPADAALRAAPRQRRRGARPARRVGRRSHRVWRDLAGWLDARTATGAPRCHHLEWSALAGELAAVRVDGRELFMRADLHPTLDTEGAAVAALRGARDVRVQRPS